jgi:hypothetical protein
MFRRCFYHDCGGTELLVNCEATLPGNWETVEFKSWSSYPRPSYYALVVRNPQDLISKVVINIRVHADR